MKKTKERVFTDAEICEIVETEMVEYGAGGYLSSAGLCHYFTRLLDYSMAKEIVFFIKHYGIWRGRYVDRYGCLVSDKSQFIYPTGQVEPRVRLMKKAVANYKRLVEGNEHP